MATDQPKRRRIRTPAEALQAGRDHARERGDRLTDEQVVRLAALVRPHLDRIRTAREAS